MADNDQAAASAAAPAAPAAPTVVCGMQIDPNLKYDIQLNGPARLFGMDLVKQVRYHLSGSAVLEIADAIGHIETSNLD